MRLDQFFPYQLAVAADAVSRALSKVYGAAHGLTREEWRILAALDGAGEVSSVEIAQRTTLDKVQVCRAAQRLEDKGLISRDVHGIDRRLRVFRLTPDGETLFRRALPQVQARAEDILSQLDPSERQALGRALSRLVQAAGPALEAGPDDGRDDGLCGDALAP
jgi:DNA-binding MarR family transcriptional regulator